VVVERRLLAQVGGFDEKQPVFEDYDLWLRLACHSEIDLIDQPLIGVRSHDQHYCGGGIRMLASRHRSLSKMYRLRDRFPSAPGRGPDARAMHTGSRESAGEYPPSGCGQDSPERLHSFVAAHGLVGRGPLGVAEVGNSTRSACPLPPWSNPPSLGEHIVPAG